MFAARAKTAHIFYEVVYFAKHENYTVCNSSGEETVKQRLRETFFSVRRAVCLSGTHFLRLPSEANHSCIQI